MAEFSVTNNKLTTYIRESIQELRKVSWPSRQVIIRDTIAVIAISVALAIFLGAVDYGLTYAFEQFLAKTGA